MKANEAPEKIYVDISLDSAWGMTERSYEGEVEYTRTDAFIEKACSWMENNLQGIVGGSVYIEDFRRYMGGE